VDSTIDNLVFRCLEMMEGEGPAALEALCEQHPDQAEELRERMQLLSRTGLIETACASDTFPEKIGDHRLLERIGAGGMGVVFRAEDARGHEVALKIMRPDQLFFPSARNRFQREVEAVARLSHSSIIQVYDVANEQDQPYFTMEYVHGISLSALIRSATSRSVELLTGRDILAALEKAGVSPGSESAESRLATSGWVESCLSIVARVASALAHAHDNGVLHRDVKPSNVMLTAGNRVLLLDFGLAAMAGADRITRSGAVMGSLPYAAPEQLDGHKVDGRADVYSLGALLFELLSLRLPYPDTDPERLRRAIRAGQAPSLRRLNPAVSPDVETVCATAMEAEVERRYDSVRAFAADITNLLSLRPVHARRSGVLGQVLYWSRHNRSAAASTLLAAILIIGGPLAFGVFSHLGAKRLAKVNDQLESAVLRGDANLLAAEAVMKELLSIGKDIEILPEMRERRVELLRRAAEVYSDLMRAPGMSAEQRGTYASSHYAVAAWLKDLGKYDLASETLQELVPVLEEDAKLLSSNDLHIEVSRYWTLLGSTQRSLARNEAASSSIENGLAAIQVVLASDPDNYHALYNLAWNRWHKGRLLRDEDRLSEAAAAMHETLAVETRLIEEFPKHGYSPGRIANTWNDLGLTLARGGLRDEALHAHEQASRLIAGFPEEELNDQAFLGVELARTRAAIGRIFAEEGRLDDAELLVRQALVTLALYRNRGDTNAEHERYYCKWNIQLGNTLLELSRLDEASTIFLETQEVLKGLRTAQPLVVQYAELEADNWAGIAELRRAEGRNREACDALASAMSAQREALRIRPVPRLQRGLSEHQSKISEFGCDAARDGVGTGSEIQPIDATSTDD